MTFAAGHQKRTLLTGGRLTRSGQGDVLAAADVLIEGKRILAVGELGDATADERVDVDGRLILPGLIDTHSHADGVIFDEQVQLALLRQGVTTVIGGQDGVSYAPGDGRYASEYFAAINGPHPRYRGGGVGALLRSYDGTTRLNVGYLVPAGTVQHEVTGNSSRAPSDDEIERMRAMVRTGMEEGALGLSSGLDYVPGLFADTALLASLVSEIAPFGGVYVTHMRGGYESNSAFGVEEAARIVGSGGVALHISHFHAEPDDIFTLMDALAEDGVDASFDAYPYGRGSTLLSMLLLPPEIIELPRAEAVQALADPSVRERLVRDWIPRVAEYPSLGQEWPSMITIAHTPAADDAWTHGATLDEVARQRGQSPADAAFDLLHAARLDVGVVMAVRRERPVAELGRIMAHPAQLGGSDGIFLGAHPHPRGFGCFATYLGVYTREQGFYTWESAARHLSARPASRFGLGTRGRVQPGAIADLALVDTEIVGARADYARPRLLAEGIDDVFVAGERVLSEGRLADATPGRGLRRQHPSTLR